MHHEGSSIRGWLTLMYKYRLAQCRGQSCPIGLLDELVCAVTGSGSLSACGDDLLVLTLVINDVSASEDSGPVGLHIEVDLDQSALGEFDSPSIEVSKVGRDTDVELEFNQVEALV